MKKKKHPRKRWGNFEVQKTIEGNYRVVMLRDEGSNRILSDFEHKPLAEDYAKKLHQGKATL